MKLINRRRQKGLSGISWLVVACIFGLLLLTFFRVFPMFYENYQLKSVLTSIQEDPSIDVKSKRAIWDTMQRRFYINAVETIKREHVKMTREDGKTTISVIYERRSPFLANLFIGGNFSETIVIDR